MSYRFLSPAFSELSEAAEYYEEKVRGLGVDFVDEVDGAIDRILRFPDAWGRLSGNYRHCKLHRFGVEQSTGPDAKPRFAQERMEGRPNLAIPARSEAPFPCVAKVAACRLAFTMGCDLWTAKLDKQNLNASKAQGEVEPQRHRGTEQFRGVAGSMRMETFQHS